MPPESGETRTLYVPRTGTKVSLLVGLALIIAAIYVAVVPLSVTSRSGPNFGCGTALSPNNDSFGKTYCSAVDDSARYRAIALGAGGIVLAGVGAALFGFDTTTRTRKPRPGFDDGYDDDADDLPPRGRRDNARRTSDAVAADDEAQGSPAPRGSAAARTGGASPAPRRSALARDRRPAADSVPADPEYDESAGDEAPHNSLRRPFSDRFAERSRARVDVDDEYDELDGPRGRR
ncbi:hypothetical protein [Allobranchiibius huperziae]|uniref:Uncharacterized protein n=1 Tax=Allobranchiibius huperziae TaxID=1874116 RepID=A0A853DD51_9MICO|nr:hypothetical protein [Allobranchiibius huperziae]NYJ74818.1 hypothetical protein [Allobranchiibius huperziae]